MTDKHSIRRKYNLAEDESKYLFGTEFEMHQQARRYVEIKAMVQKRDEIKAMPLSELLRQMNDPSSLIGSCWARSVEATFGPDGPPSGGRP